MKTKLILCFVSLMLIVITALSVCAVASVSATGADYIVVTTDAVRLRSAPEINDENFITTLNVNESLTLLSNSADGWANVRRSGGEEGYCSVDYLSVPEASDITFTGITTDEVNFRQGPSTDYPSNGLLPKGQEYTVLDNTNETWVNIKIDDTEGYVYRSYALLSLTINTSEATTPSEPATEATTEATESTEAPTEPTEAPTEPQTPSVPSVNPQRTPNCYSASLLEGDSLSSKIRFTGEFVLTDKELSLNTGDTYKLSTLILGVGLDSVVTFKSSDNSVATVSESGVVTALTEGNTEISATFGGKTDTCVVSVTGEPFVPTAPTEPTDPETTAPSTTVPPTENTTFELSALAASVEKGNLYVLTSPMKNSVWSSSNEKVATVKGGLVTAVSEGEAIITATADGKVGTCKITVTKASTGLSIEYSEVTVTKGKTFYNGGASSGYISWTSSDTSVATVSNGFITGVNEGTAVVTAYSDKGTKTCLVTVRSAEPVRFAYAYPNTAAKNETVSLVAITDKTRTAVQFKIDINGTVKTVDAESKKADGNTIIWTGTTEISQAGTFKVTAYSKLGSKFSSCADSKTTVFIRENADLLKETGEDRRASDQLISLLASFEGYVGNVYFDNLAGGIPTLGYGKVVYIGDSFYNDMTKTEAYAQLYDTVNNGGYSSNVNAYLQSLDANYNQQQFDALVSFAYNIGYYGLKSDSEIRALILEAKEKKEAENTDKNAAYVNGTQVNFRVGAGTEFESLGWLSYPDTLTLVDTKLHNDVWYHVKTADGREGYIYKDYVTLGVPTVEGEIYLSLIDRAEFTRVLLEYHHAGGNCIYGLMYRRVDELDLFYYGDYERDGDENRFGYSFVCDRDKSFKL